MGIAGRYVVAVRVVGGLFAGGAWGKGMSERAAILDAARPMAAEKAGQAVRIEVDRLNIDSGWAMLIGELVGPPGKRIDWAKAKTGKLLLPPRQSRGNSLSCYAMTADRCIANICGAQSQRLLRPNS